MSAGGWRIPTLSSVRGLLDRTRRARARTSNRQCRRKSCLSLLLMILVSITFFSWNYPIQKEIGIIRGLLIIIPSTFLLILLWNGNFIHESHAHMEIFSAEFSSLYPLFLFWYLFLIVLNSIWIIQKLKSAQDSNLRNQLLFYLFGLIITNIATFIFGLFLPWILGFLS